jgi:hypothetical protein
MITADKLLKREGWANMDESREFGLVLLAAVHKHGDNGPTYGAVRDFVVWTPCARVLTRTCWKCVQRQKFNIAPDMRNFSYGTFGNNWCDRAGPVSWPHCCPELIFNNDNFIDPLLLYLPQSPQRWRYKALACWLLHFWHLRNFCHVQNNHLSVL